MRIQSPGVIRRSVTSASTSTRGAEDVDVGDKDEDEDEGDRDRDHAPYLYFVPQTSHSRQLSPRLLP